MTIEAINLTKSFGSIHAVDDLSFRVGKGEVLGLLGPNGAGKSTTMKMLTGFLAPTSGTAKICGHDVLENPMGVRRSVGYLPESAPAYDEMTVVAFLKFIAQVRGYRGGEVGRRVDGAVDMCFLGSVRHQTFETLSKGYKRRVCLAQALLHDPPVLIMDEPTEGLDPNQKYEVRQLIAAMARDKVILLSTHILEEVEAVCTRAIIIAGGRKIVDETPEELCRRSPHHGAVVMTVRDGEASAIAEALGGLDSVREVVSLVDDAEIDGAPLRYRLMPKSDRVLVADVAELAREKNWEVDELTVETGRLDEVFRELTESAKGASRS